MTVSSSASAVTSSDAVAVLEQDQLLLGRARVGRSSAALAWPAKLAAMARSACVNGRRSCARASYHDYAGGLIALAAVAAACIAVSVARRRATADASGRLRATAERAWS